MIAGKAIFHEIFCTMFRAIPEFDTAEDISFQRLDVIGEKAPSLHA
jgi:hypothetical protein